MIHYTCDRCHKLIETDVEMRYVVRIEMKAADEPHFGEGDEENDHLLELQETLERMEDAPDEFDDPVDPRRRFDLCVDCFREYQKNPLGLEPQLHIGFSEN